MIVHMKTLALERMLQGGDMRRGSWTDRRSPFVNRLTRGILAAVDTMPCDFRKTSSRQFCRRCPRLLALASQSGE